MKRDTSVFDRKIYDLLVIGGGISGATAAWDAAQRGLSVCLIDRGDFGAATSFNGLRMVHGGLRFHPRLNFSRMRESVSERRTLMRIAPHLVHPLACLLPTYGRGLRSRAALRTAMFINDAIGFDRNFRSDPQKTIPSGRLLSRIECASLLPGVREEGLTGGALWFDGQLHNSERLTLAFVLSAANAGADVANYVEALSFLWRGTRVSGVKARDALTQQDFSIQARVVLNAAGPWINRVLRSTEKQTERVPFTQAISLLLRRPLVPRYAAAVSEPGGPAFLLAPWRDLGLAGTWHRAFEGEPDEVQISDDDIATFIGMINRAYPAAKLVREDVLEPLSGLLPGTVGSGNNPPVRLRRQPRLIDHRRRDGIGGLISLVAVQYSSARRVASVAVDAVIAKLGRKSISCQTARTPLAGGQIKRFGEFVQAQLRKHRAYLPPEVIRHLVYCYGSDYESVLEQSDRVGMGRQCFSRRSNVIKAEVLNAVRVEMALTLEDVVFRRTELGRAGFPGEAGLAACAEIMGALLNWTNERRERELESVRARFHVAPASKQLDGGAALPV